MFGIFLPWKIRSLTQFQNGNCQNVRGVIALMRGIAIEIAQDGQHGWTERVACAGRAHQRQSQVHENTWDERMSLVAVLYGGEGTAVQ